jgi:hypothetical protein
MIKLTAAQTQIRLLRLIPGWKYASRSGPYHVGQGYNLLCAVLVLEDALIVKTVMHHFEIR